MLTERQVERGLCIVIAAVTAPLCWWLWVRTMKAPEQRTHAGQMWASSIAARGNNVDPNHWQTYRAIYNLAYEQLRQGDLLSAVKNLKQCYDQCPKASVVWSLATIQLAVLAEHMGDDKNAVAYYAQFARYHPQAVVVRQEMGGAILRMKRYRMELARMQTKEDEAIK